MTNLTPYDADKRLEPQVWVSPHTGLTQGRPAEPDDWGKVDFDDSEGYTFAIVYVELTEYGAIMHIQCNEPVIIHGPGDEYLGTAEPL